MASAILEFRDCATARALIPSLEGLGTVVHVPQCLPFVVLEGSSQSIRRARRLPGVVAVTRDSQTRAQICPFRGRGEMELRQIRTVLRDEDKRWDGNGITVAVLDSGIDTEHPMLRGRVLQSIDVTGEGVLGDEVGHGTCVASILGGRRVEGTPFGPLEGLSKGVRFISVKVFNKEGKGSLGWLVAGLDEAYANRADIINYSGGGRGDPADGPQERAVNMLATQGILTVAAAGNEGSRPVSTPAAAPGAICVGALGYELQRVPWSNSGSSFRGLIKPDVVAPGEAIVGAASGWLDGIWDGRKDGYDVFTGTSFATPQVTAILAQLMQISRRKISRREAECLLSLNGGKKTQAVGWGLPDAQRMQKKVLERVSAR